MIKTLLGGALCAALALGLMPARAGAALPDAKDLGGRITAEAAGKTILFPSLKTDIVADVQGDLVTVTVTQTFVNPTPTPLNARYLFPLHKEAAVFAMTMAVGEEIVQAKIREREEARQTFEQGKREGKAAALLEQHRPNNVRPGDRQPDAGRSHQGHAQIHANRTAHRWRLRAGRAAGGRAALHPR